MPDIGRFEYVITDDVLSATARNLVPVFRPRPLPPEVRRVLRASWYGCGLSGAILAGGLYTELPDSALFVPAVGLALSITLPLLFGLLFLFERGTVLLTMVSQWFVKTRLRRTSQKLIDTTVTWRFDENGFESQSVERVRMGNWNELKQVQQLPEYWVLKLQSGQALFLPAQLLSERVQDLILRKMSQHKSRS